MARPLKDGVDYWAFDVTLLQDRKFRLIRSEFGVYGVYIALELLNLAYREHGYYAPFGEEDCLLLAESIGGCAPDLIRTVQICGTAPVSPETAAYMELLRQQKAEIEDFADSLTSPRKRRLVRCVMQHGRRWNVIRRLMGGDKSPDAVRMEFERIFKNF